MWIIAAILVGAGLAAVGYLEIIGREMGRADARDQER
jgi:hypothetical protein